MEQLEFKIDSLPDYTFRVKKLSVEEINAVAMVMDLGSITQTIQVNKFVLEHLEVDIKGTWVQVKQKKDYWPASLEDDPIATRELIEWFLEHIIFNVFLKSSESK